MRRESYKHQLSLYLNRRDLIRAGVSAAGLALFGSIPGCAPKRNQGDNPPTIYGSATSANPGDTLALWIPGDLLTTTVPMTADGNRAAALKYSRSTALFEVPQTASGIYLIENQRPLLYKSNTPRYTFALTSPDYKKIW